MALRGHVPYWRAGAFTRADEASLKHFAASMTQIQRLRARRRLLIAAAAVFALLVAAAALWAWNRPASDSAAEPPPNAATAGSVRLALPPPDLLRPLTPEEAQAENAERPFSDRPDSAAAAFRLSADEISKLRAIECLTQAVYYEAASEGVDGGRAVAQVVLNRMRHPAYPASVCGVVYQGSERATGCQFTFTCDGSLARTPAQSLWSQARRIAAEALAGKVFAPVGHSTHYHADYVLPYWADSLDKMVQIGRHIFYRLKGGLGSPAAFRQRYAGAEPLPLSPTAAEVATEAVEKADELLAPKAAEPVSNLIERSGELVAGGGTVAAPRDNPLLAADAAGTLIAGGEPVVPSRTAGRTRAPEACAEAGTNGKIERLGANDLRVGRGTRC
jgi:spore germination cell wall hydrolase CwlJ-like protein